MKITCPNCRGRARVKTDGTLAVHHNNWTRPMHSRTLPVCRLVGKVPTRNGKVVTK